MASFDYADMQATAAELIAEFGQIGAVISITAPDPLTGGDPVEVSAPATLVPMKYDARQIDGTVILAGDIQVYISAVGLSIRPDVGVHVICGGKRYRIVDPDPYNFNGQTDVVYVCQARIAQ